ncbi:glycosyltransferase family 2 protein [Empedobacter sp.]|uniref:glycosyltransferase family 2 protein n=1 Tax=Empedobacter sp. TaxID=1927715 RepID=UPI002897828E|nr:glycosyltransferase family 2 protein [Empedobacter sp.]
MTEQPLVSIIIPIYNRADLIGETLDSIIDQTYQNWECIVVDDGSTDYTSEILSHYTQKDSRISYHHRPKQYKPGGNGARNYGFDLSKGEYINWFDSDDVMLETFIADKVINIGNKDFIICSHSTVDAELKLIKHYDIIIEKNILYDYLVWHDNFNVLTSSILFKKTFLLQNNFRYNEKILRGQEAEFLLNIFSKKYHDLHFKIINKPLFLYRQHALTKTVMNENGIIKFNYSHSFINFQKLQIAQDNNYTDLIDKINSTLKILSIKVVKDRDFSTMNFIVKKLINSKKIFLGIGIYLFYFFNKTPNFIYNQWLKK